MNPKAELWLLRHAESTGNRDGKLQGQEDLPLCPLGHRQARCLADRLAKAHRKVPFVALYTSDLVRARETAESIGMACDLRAQSDRRLREIDVGTWSGLTQEQIAVALPAEWAAWRSRDPRMRRGGGESYVDAFERVRPALTEITGRHGSGRVLVVTHGGVLRAWLADLMGIPFERMWHLSIGNTSLTRVRPYEAAIGGDAPRQGRVLCLNDCTHAEDLSMRSGEL